MKINEIDTEKINQKSISIDKKDTLEMLKIINDEDKEIAYKIELELPRIAQMIDLITEKIKLGGRVFYVGAGTSGRIGILDASEMLPTYNDNKTFFAIIAGGDEAIKYPSEGAEDSLINFQNDIKIFNFSDKDTVIGIGASGRTPYVISALKYAKEKGGSAFAICMSNKNEFENFADKTIVINTGPEVITGSTRMKAGTATKMICNMISTSVMIKKGKVHNNLMIDLKATNKKLQQRCIDIFMSITNEKDYQKALSFLEKRNWDIRKSISDYGIL